MREVKYKCPAVVRQPVRLTVVALKAFVFPCLISLLYGMTHLGLHLTLVSN